MEAACIGLTLVGAKEKDREKTSCSLAEVSRPHQTPSPQVSLGACRQAELGYGRKGRASGGLGIS